MDTMPLYTPEDVVKQGRKHFSSIGLMYFLGTLVIYGFQLGAQLIIKRFWPDILNDPNFSLLCNMATMYLISMPLMMLMIRSVPAVKVEKHPMSFGKLLIALIMCYSIMYCSNIIGTIITFIIGLVKGAPVNNVIQEVATSIHPLLSFFIMVICAPVMEELIFRKLLVDRAVRYGQGIAVVLSGLMFGLFHGNLSQFVYAFALGMFLAFLYVRTGKIQYTIVLHMAVNFVGGVIAPALLKLLDYDSLNAAMASQDEQIIMQAMADVFPGLLVFLLYLLLLFGVVIAGIVLLIVFRKKFKLAGGAVLPKGKKFSTVILNVGMILFCLFWIVMIVLQLIE